jgi:hypothetical protein
LPAQWFPNSWDVSVAGGDRTIPIKTAFPLYASVGTKGAIDLEPVWAGTGLPADFIGRDVRGKAAVIYEGTRDIHTLMQADWALGLKKEKPARRMLPPQRRGSTHCQNYPRPQ